MLKSKLKYLKKEISFLELQIVENIERCLKNLDIEVNIVECKRSDHQNNFKKSKKIEVHFLDKCLTMNSGNREILYKDTTIELSEVEISQEFYTKLFIHVEMRQSILKMENKLENLKKILINNKKENL